MLHFDVMELIGGPRVANGWPLWEKWRYLGAGLTGCWIVTML